MAHEEEEREANREEEIMDVERFFKLRKEEMLRVLQRMADMLVDNFTVSFQNELRFMVGLVDHVIHYVIGGGGGIFMRERHEDSRSANGSSSQAYGRNNGAFVNQL